MHIVLVSQCEKKAILRTAKVLDAYAIRHGDRTWITPITKLGLAALYQELRSRSTRQTAVACYVNEGARRLRLAWTVGRKSTFGGEGAVAVATKTSKGNALSPALSPALRLACLLAECAGLVHDFGKYGRIFQEKLSSGQRLADPVRHEWISLQVLLRLYEGKSWEESWNAPQLLRMADYREHQHGIGAGLKTIEAVLAFLVMSHHRLPTAQKAGRGSTATSAFPGDDAFIREGEERRPNPYVGEPSPLDMSRIKRLVQRIRQYRLTESTPETFRALATVSRIALILADHAVSGVDKTQSEGNGMHLATHPDAVFANTTDHNGVRVKNQALNWHLSHVGNEASAMVSRMLTFQPPGLTGTAVARLRERSTDRFQWQNRAADAIEDAQRQEPLPTLVLNIAGTGSGKTRMNMRAVAALHPPDEEGNQTPLRVATALNLRTLTLQTRDAYAKQLGLDKEELACVIGDKISIRLHEAGKKSDAVFDDDENEPEEDFEFVGQAADPPEWLRGFLEKKPVLKPLIMSPVVVSTIDFLINAGEPHRQGNHGLAMLRMMHSDLILDEIDAYDPKAMVAVARLVTASAMWGRDVIASSATLSPPVVKVLYDAFELGMKLRGGLHGSAVRWRQVVIDDRVAPLVATCETASEFLSAFSGHLQMMMGAMGEQRFRPAELQAVDRAGGRARGETNFFTAIEKACMRMHERHAWDAPANIASFAGKISIGLVRVANIRVAIKVARRLAESLPDVRVCCYHAQVGLLQRWNIERTLDDILTRKSAMWKSHTLQNAFMEEALRRAVATGGSDLRCIVVATPVEEIGRDHDFDWAVIEPSSSQSIVQTAGRVNRHRLDAIASPNIAVLQFNYHTCTKEPGDPVFCRPGLESESTMDAYGQHDLAQLVNWPALQIAGQIDARLRYQTQVHPFALADDRALSRAVESHLSRFIKSDGCAWLMKDTYAKAPLRDNAGSLREEWFVDEHGVYFRQEPNGKTGKVFAPKRRDPDPDAVVDPHANDWLVLDLAQLCLLARENSVPIDKATSVEVRSIGTDGEVGLFRDMSFGYFTERYRVA